MSNLIIPYFFQAYNNLPEIYVYLDKFFTVTRLGFLGNLTNAGLYSIPLDKSDFIKLDTGLD